MKRLTAAGLTLLLAAFALQLVPAGLDAVAATEDVGVQDDVFVPANVTINAGDTVLWTWSGVNPHTVTSDTGLFDTPEQTSGTFSFVFNDPGTYAYYCSVHGAPGGIGMSGTVTVQSAPTQTPAAASPTPDDDETPEATATAAQASPTVAPGTTPTPIEAMPIAAPVTPVAGAPGPATQLPTSGTGARDSGGIPAWISVALAVAGTALLSGALYARRRA